MKRLWFVWLIVLLLAACSVAAESEPAVTVTPPATITPVPTVTPLPPPQPPTVETGLTAEGAFYKGSPDAPVTMIDYSNFL